MELIKINGRSFVIGLYWIPVTSERVKRQEIQQYAEDAKGVLGQPADAYALRLSGSPQLGLAVAGEPELPKAWSLAANIAVLYREPWLGVYRLSEDRYWFIAVHSGQAIMNDGDLVGTYDEVMEAKERHLAIDGWDERSGGISELSEMVARVQRLDGRLRPVKIAFPWKTALRVGIAAGALAIVGAGWRLYEARKERLLEQRRQEQLLRESLARGRHEPEQPPTSMPWAEQPTTDSLLGRCVGIFSGSPLFVGGWRAEEWSCDQSHWEYKWVLEPGGSLLVAPAGQINQDGSLIAQSGPMGPNFRYRREALLAEQSALRALYGTLQRLNIKPTVTLQNPTPKVLPGDKPPPPDPWSKYSVAFILPVNPELFVSELARIPGFRVVKVSAKLSAAVDSGSVRANSDRQNQTSGSQPAQGLRLSVIEWKIEGDLYAHR